MERAGDPLLSEVDDLIVCSAPAGDNAYRSRFVKTSLRNLIEGRFLFLDGDTLVRDDLSAVFTLSCDVAGCPNHSKDKISDQIWAVDHQTLLQMNWKARNDVYINTGVLFFNDTPSSKLLSLCWHNKWKGSYLATKNHRDQAAFNSALFNSGAQLHVLPHRYNAQIKSEVTVADGAAIWHHYASDIPSTAFEALVDKVLKGTATLTRPHIKSIIRHNHPWRRDSWVDDLAARRAMKKGHFDREDLVWFQGHRIKSLAYRIKNHLRPLIKGNAIRGPGA
jgi:lipopolysaccharide biosynthesis glycosyltransferase